MGDTELPKMYKACVYDNPGHISTKIAELEMPEPGPGQVLINLYVSTPQPSTPLHPLLAPSRPSAPGRRC